MDIGKPDANEENRLAWDANASFWNEKMGDGNDFVNILLWPSVSRLLAPRRGIKILDIATGNGLIARRLADLGAEVTAFDFSSQLISLAAAQTNASSAIKYQIIDATDEHSLLSLGSGVFDSAICNMALFDIADIRPLFSVLPKLLKPAGTFVFSITHPAFNNSSAVHIGEESDDEGKINTVYSVKVSRYQSAFQSRGLAMRDQPHPQLYFDRPLHTYFDLGFQNGFILDGFEECSFPPDHPQKNPLSWGGNFSEIPPVLIARMRLLQ